MKLKFLLVPALFLALGAFGASAETDYDFGIDSLLKEVESITATDDLYDGDVFKKDTNSSASLSFAGTLRRGAKNDRVLELQKKLKSLGFYNRALDSDFGSGTLAAVRAFQAANGLSVDGVAGPKTFAKIIASGGGYTLPPVTTDGACADIYEPVCAYKVSSSCADTAGAVDADCEQTKELTTYSNKCEMRAAGAIYKHGGECDSTRPVEKDDNVREEYIKKMIERLKNYVEKLEKLIDRIENKIEELESEL